jgi:hypothetical protein
LIFFSFFSSGTKLRARRIEDNFGRIPTGYSRQEVADDFGNGQAGRPRGGFGNQILGCRLVVAQLRKEERKKKNKKNRTSFFFFPFLLKTLTLTN